MTAPPDSPHFNDFKKELRKCMLIPDGDLRKKEIMILVNFFLQHNKTTNEERLYILWVKEQAKNVLQSMRAKEHANYRNKNNN